ncbi:hypothetical protein [Bradyrhizobium sp. LTSPM299]|jgi:hypothetical protein|nr:hypothetical protein [Bradyrhizobium sp. LTSPM299]
MIAVLRAAAEARATSPVSSLAIVVIFSLVGLTLSLAFARYGVDITAGI